MPSLLIATQNKNSPTTDPESLYFIAVGPTMSLWLWQGSNFFSIVRYVLPDLTESDSITDLFMSSNQTFCLASTDANLYLLSVPSLTIVDKIALPGSFNPLCHSLKTAIWVRSDETAVSVLPRFGCQLLTVSILRSWSTTPSQMSLSVSRSAEFDPTNVGYAKAIWGHSPNMSNPLKDEFVVSGLSATRLVPNNTVVEFNRFNSTLFNTESVLSLLSIDQRDVVDGVVSADAMFPSWDGQFFSDCTSLIAFDFGTFNATAVLDLSPSFHNLVNSSQLFNHSCALFIGASPAPNSPMNSALLRAYFSYGGFVVSYDIPAPSTWTYASLFHDFFLLIYVSLSALCFCSVAKQTMDNEGWVIVVILGCVLFVITVLLLFLVIVSHIGRRTGTDWDSMSD